MRVFTLVWSATSSGVSLLEEAAGACVQPLGVLADDDEVDVLRAFAEDRGGNARIELHRTQVDVLVELEADLQDEAALEDARRDVVAREPGPHGALVDGVDGLEVVEHRVRKHLAVARVAPGADVVDDALGAQTEARARRASSTFSPSAIISGPVPSPGMTAIR